jgi:RimJ/RimL family protein N-acetyltransferase
MEESKKEQAVDASIPCTTYFKGKKVSLVPFEKEDIPLVAKWNNIEELNAFSHSRFPVSVFEQTDWYEKTMKDKTKKKLLVMSNETKDKVGMVSLFEIDMKNRNSMIGSYVAPEFQGRGYAKEAKRLLIRFAFQELNLHKLYGNVIDFGDKVMGIDASIGLTHECTLKEHMYTNGKYYDIHVVALLKKDWEEKFRDKW